MKKTYSFLFIALCLFAYSCRKDPATNSNPDNNNPPVLSGDINGTWLITKKHYSIYAVPSVFVPTDHLKTDTLVMDVTFDVDFTSTEKMYAIFKSDGTAALINFPFVFNNEQPRSGDTTYLTYKRVNNLISYYLPENSATTVYRYTILSLQPTMLEVQSSYIGAIIDSQISGLKLGKYYYQFEDDFYTKQ